MHSRLPLAFILAVALSSSAFADQGKAGAMYKSPGCECGEDYAYYLRDRGYKITVFPTIDMEGIKKRNGIPEKLASCHTLVIGRYVVEGHVPVKLVDRLLKEKPAIRGIALPGRPEGSPGVTGEKRQPFTIYEIGSQPDKVFAID